MASCDDWWKALREAWLGGIQARTRVGYISCLQRVNVSVI